MARLNKGLGAYDFWLVDPSDDTRTVGLMIDTNSRTKRREWSADFAPTVSGQTAPAGRFVDWLWQNGSGGAGHSVETPRSYQEGGCDYGEFVWLRRPGVAMASGKLHEIELPAALAAITTGSIFNAFEWGVLNQDLYLTTGTRYMLKIPNGLGTGADIPTIATDFGAGAVTTDCAIFDGAGSAHAYVTCPGQNLRGWDGSTWAEGVDTERNYLTTVHWQLGAQMATGGAAGEAGTHAYRLIGTDSDGNGFFHVAGDPLVTAAWAAETKVGDLAFPTFNVVSDGHVVWFAKPNGLHGVTEDGYDPNITKWMETAFSPFQGSIVEYWDGRVWFDHQQGLCVINVDGTRQDVSVFVNYGFGQSNLSPIFGKPTALTPGADCMYVAYRSGTTTDDSAYIGTVRIEQGVPRWSMAECVIPGQTVTFMKQTAPGGIPRLWIGTTHNETDANGTAGELHLYYQELPATGDPEMDALQSTGFNCAEEWSLRLSRFDGGTPVPKVFRRFEVEADGIGGANQVTVSLSAHGGTFAQQGSVTSATEGRGSVTPLTGYVRSPSAQVKLDVQNAPTVPVIVRSVAVRYSPRPEQSKIVTASVILGEGVQLKHGHGTDQQDPGVALATIEDFQDVDPLELHDPFGRILEGIIEAPFSEQISESDDGMAWVVRGTLRYSITRQSGFWDRSSWDGPETFE